MQRDSIFRIASMTKPVTAVATMILVEECKLRLDEPVDRLLPGARRPAGARRPRPAARRHRCPPTRPITVRDLLTFTHGPRDRHGRRPARPRSATRSRSCELGDGSTRCPDGPPAPDEWMRRLRHAAARAPARRAMDVQHRRRRARRARRPRRGPVVPEISCASASSSRSGCTTPRSACRPRRSTGSPPDTGRTSRRARSRCTTKRSAGSGTRHRPSPPGRIRAGVDRGRLRRVRARCCCAAVRSAATACWRGRPSS